MAKKIPLYLHIGRPKVGSTAVQHFLWQNRKNLLEQGFLYPETALNHRASHKLALVFQPNLPAHKVVNSTTPEAVYQGVEDEAIAANAKAIVASSENLFLVEPNLVYKLCKGRFQTKIICYIRRQDEVLVSSYLQELKTGHVDLEESIEEYASHPERLRWLDYEAVLDRWSDQFGRKNLEVRVLEPAQIKGSIFEDFAGLVGFNMRDFQLPETRVNPSPARDVLDFIRIINDAPVTGPAVLKHPFREPLLAVSETLGHGGIFNPKLMVPNYIRQQLLDRFEASNLAVARKYLGRRNGVLFEDLALPREPASVAYTGMELERFASMAATLFCFQQQQIQQLKTQVDKLRTRIARQEADQSP